jgi:DNA-binding XRE family transcriptional regulator
MALRRKTGQTGAGAPPPAAGCTGSQNDGAGQPRAEWFRSARRQFGVTQAHLAAALGTSLKTIQSYEQGWRHIPTRVLTQLLVLLAIYRRRELGAVPCWKLKHCPSEVRRTCASYTLGDGQLCWFVTAGGGCGGCAGSGRRKDSMPPCLGCEVVRRLLRPSAAADSAAPGDSPVANGGTAGRTGRSPRAQR